MQLHGIKVHLYMPAGILSPGYENEQKTKPDITKKIEDGDTPISAEAAAGLLIAGIEKGHYQITNDLITDLIRAVSAGAVPGNGVLDFVYGFIGSVSLSLGVVGLGTWLTVDWGVYLAYDDGLAGPWCEEER